MALTHGKAPGTYVGLQAEAYEIGASQGYDHVAHALAYGTGEEDKVDEPRRWLVGQRKAWEQGWAAGAKDARRDHKD